MGNMKLNVPDILFIFDIYFSELHNTIPLPTILVVICGIIDLLTNKQSNQPNVQ